MQLQAEVSNSQTLATLEISERSEHMPSRLYWTEQSTFPGAAIPFLGELISIQG
jgi:hypothetical protein